MNNDISGMLSSILSDPKAMEKAVSLANMLSSSGALEGILGSAQGTDQKPHAVNVEDVATLEKRSDRGRSSVSMNDRIALLLAIRPYLSKEKADKLDSVVRILKIVGTIESSGIKLF